MRVVEFGPDTDFLANQTGGGVDELQCGRVAFKTHGGFAGGLFDDDRDRDAHFQSSCRDCRDIDLCPDTLGRDDLQDLFARLGSLTGLLEGSRDEAIPRGLQLENIQFGFGLQQSLLVDFVFFLEATDLGLCRFGRQTEFVDVDLGVQFIGLSCCVERAFEGWCGGRQLGISVRGYSLLVFIGL